MFAKLQLCVEQELGRLSNQIIMYLVRYDFRKRVADVLEVQVSRVSILPGALSTMAGGQCQQVTFLVSGKTVKRL